MVIAGENLYLKLWTGILCKFVVVVFLLGSLRRSSPRVELSNKSNSCVIQLKGK